jgi:2'-5' RNA ligase
VDEPLVVTLAVEDAVQHRWDDLRSRLFPAGRTQVGAHITLFHAVPGELQAEVRADLADVAGPAFTLTVDRVLSLGRGAAYGLTAAELARRHRELQRRWWPHLTAQDRQPLRAHVTVQNKVTPEVARRTVDELRRDFAPSTVTACAFQLWAYAGGPWRALDRIEFAA